LLVYLALFHGVQSECKFTRTPDPCRDNHRFGDKGGLVGLAGLPARDAYGLSGRDPLDQLTQNCL
jgi:hypothetical protein